MLHYLRQLIYSDYSCNYRAKKKYQRRQKKIIIIQLFNQISSCTTGQQLGQHVEHMLHYHTCSITVVGVVTWCVVTAVNGPLCPAWDTWILCWSVGTVPQSVSLRKSSFNTTSSPWWMVSLRLRFPNVEVGEIDTNSLLTEFGIGPFLAGFPVPGGCSIVM